jgi:F0F1-type ATP synthase assembly protein I
MTAMLKKLQKQKIKPLKSLNNYARYSGLAFEMIFIILVGVFGGIKLDNVLDTKPLLTALLSLTGVVLAVFFAIKDFLRKPKNDGKVN